MYSETSTNSWISYKNKKKDSDYLKNKFLFFLLLQKNSSIIIIIIIILVCF